MPRTGPGGNWVIPPTPGAGCGPQQPPPRQRGLITTILWEPTEPCRAGERVSGSTRIPPPVGPKGNGRRGAAAKRAPQTAPASTPAVPPSLKAAQGGRRAGGATPLRFTKPHRELGGQGKRQGPGDAAAPRLPNPLDPPHNKPRGEAHYARFVSRLRTRED
ncbi:hypothetical protein GWK47_026294 [Chionoecetes opilio]|uniref:Uncharacterized protein n=1 Tax=Chionoecetes opilio TaxID=41210 RepID=A0A8J8WMT5_CHIOP|nr:hypothetical protein GWK47_026294 [Chionoecetes opilio]